MKRVLRFTWITMPTTTAGHMATSLIATNKYTRDFVERAFAPHGASAGVYGFDASYLGEKKEFRNQSITIR